MIIWRMHGGGICHTHIQGYFLLYITSAQLHTSLIVVIVNYSSYKLTCLGRRLTYDNLQQYPLAIPRDSPLTCISVGRCDMILAHVTCAIDVCGVPTLGLHIQTQLEGLQLFWLICTVKQTFPSCNAIGKTLNKQRIFVASSTKEMFISFFPHYPFVHLKSLPP